MALARLLLQLAGGVALLIGLFFVGQGLGVIRWPASSFMIDESAWAWRGALLALGGAMMIWAGRRRRP